MNDGEYVLTSGALAAALIEAIKWIVRSVKKDPLFDFPVKFYAVAIPVMTFVCQIPLAYLKSGGYKLPTDWMEWGRQLLLVFLSALVAMAVHTTALKPMSSKVKYVLTK